MLAWTSDDESKRRRTQLLTLTLRSLCGYSTDLLLSTHSSTALSMLRLIPVRRAAAACIPQLAAARCSSLPVAPALTLYPRALHSAASLSQQSNRNKHGHKDNAPHRERQHGADSKKRERREAQEAQETQEQERAEHSPSATAARLEAIYAALNTSQRQAARRSPASMSSPPFTAAEDSLVQEALQLWSAAKENPAARIDAAVTGAMRKLSALVGSKPPPKQP